MSHAWSDEEVKSFKLLLRKIIEKFESVEDIVEARAVAKLLIEINSKDAEAWHYLGALNGILGEFNEAQKDLNYSLELGGEELPNYIQLANVYMNQGNFKEALDWIYKAKGCAPVDVFIYYKIADLHLLDGDVFKAIKVLESALKIPHIKIEDRYRTLVQVANLCMQIDQMKKASKYFKEAQELNPSDESLWTDIGHCLSRMEDKEGALEAFKKAASSKPTPRDLYNLGDAYLAIDDPEKSIAPLVAATREDPSYSLAHYNLSLAFVRMGKYNEGAKAAIAALRPDPEMKLAQTNLGMNVTNNLGMCLMNRRRYNEALECYQRNIKLFDSTYFNMGLTLFRMKRFKDALECFLNALKISPDDPEYLDLVGQTYCELGKHKIGESYLRKCIKNDPKYALGYHDLGIVLSKYKKRRAEALHCYMTAIKLDPDSHYWTYYGVACLHALSGDKEKAINYLKKALEKGFSDQKHIDSDPDLKSLRKDAEFKKLMIKYFPHSKK